LAVTEGADVSPAGIGDDLGCSDARASARTNQTKRVGCQDVGKQPDNHACPFVAPTLYLAASVLAWSIAHHFAASSLSAFLISGLAFFK
jgi:hypothetical protein